MNRSGKHTASRVGGLAMALTIPYSARVRGQRGLTHPSHWQRSKRPSGKTLDAAVARYWQAVRDAGLANHQTDKDAREALSERYARRWAWLLKVGRRKAVSAPAT